VIVVTDRVAECPVCHGTGDIDRYPRPVQDCTACRGTGRIRQAAETTEETP
jgi:DnaJ-class molecular chaperone